MGPFRLDPKLPTHAVKTYQITSPLATHTRPATCAEVDCDNYTNGWRVRVEGLTPQMLHTAKNSGRRWSEQSIAEGETWLLFEPGQQCFAVSTHRVATRPELYVVRDGDWRGNPRGTQARKHTRPEFWVEDFAEHQQSLADKIKEG